MSAQELRLPRRIMEFSEGGPEYKPLTNAELKEVVGVKLPQVVDLYRGMLTEDTQFFKRAELSRLTGEELERHLKELEELRQLLKEFGENPDSFVTRGQNVDADAKTWSAKLKRASDTQIGIGIENAQTQLSFYAHTEDSGESRDAAISGASIKGVAPVIALRKANQEVSGGNVIINTVKIFRSATSSAIRVHPQAGIEIIKEGPYVDINGLKSLGAGHFHRYEVPNEGDIEMSDFNVALDLTKKLSGAV